MSAKRNNAFNSYPRFIFDGSEDEAPEDFYLTHTRHPRFLAKGYVQEDYSEAPQEAMNSVVANHERHGLVCTTDAGIHFKDFIFLDGQGVPDKNEIAEACLQAVIAYKLRGLEKND